MAANVGSRSQLQRAIAMSSLPLPSYSTIRRETSDLTAKPGWHDENVAALRDWVLSKKLGRDEYAPLRQTIILAFDDMKIRSGIQMEPSSNGLYGFAADPVKQSKRGGVRKGPEIATQMLQFHVKGLFANFEAPIAFYPNNGYNAEFLELAVWQGVRLLEKHGFTVLLFVCDGAGANRRLIRATKAAYVGITRNVISGGPIIIFQDPPHLLKKLRNSFYNRILQRPLCDPIRWDFLEKLVELDERRPFPGLKSLKRACLTINHYTKMKVKHAQGVFSREVHERLRQLNDSEFGGKAEGSNLKSVSFYLKNLS